MIPLKDDNPTHRFPLVTVLLIAANVAVFLLQKTLGAEGERGFVMSFGLIPFEVTSGQDLEPLGPLPPLANTLTSMFMHANLMHLGGNMLYLWIFGNNIEDELGKGRYLLFYLMGGALAAATHVLTGPGSRIPVIGASGAVAAVLGGYIVLHPKARVLTLLPIFYFIRLIWIPAGVVLGLWFLIQLLNGLPSLGGAEGGVAWFAHIGGFLFGAAWFAIGRGRRSRRRRDWWASQDLA